MDILNEGWWLDAWKMYPLGVCHRSTTHDDALMACPKCDWVVPVSVFYSYSEAHDRNRVIEGGVFDGHETMLDVLVGYYGELEKSGEMEFEEESVLEQGGYYWEFEDYRLQTAEFDSMESGGEYELKETWECPICGNSFSATHQVTVTRPA